MNKTSSVQRFLILTSLDGKETKIQLNKEKTTIGRLSDNDIQLSPDPQNLVTRIEHCYIKVKNHNSFLIDLNSVNGTFVKRQDVIHRIEGEFKLQTDDIIMIIGSTDYANESVKYWKMRYEDPEGTAVLASSMTELIYDESQAKLIVRKGKKEIKACILTPIENKLIEFMFQKNAANNHKPCLCKYYELIPAIWNDGYLHEKNDVNHIIAALRKKIEFDITTPIFIINRRGEGYELVTNPDQ